MVEDMAVLRKAKRRRMLLEKKRRWGFWLLSLVIENLEYMSSSAKKNYD
jgi:hypothetical protein